MKKKPLPYSASYSKLPSLLAVLIPIFSFCQQGKGYEIEGHISGLRDGEQVTMLLTIPDSHNFERRDSALVSKGSFHLSGLVPQGPRAYWMNFEGHKGKHLRVVIDNGEKIIIQHDGTPIEKIPHGFLDDYIQVDGSPSDYAWQLLCGAADIMYWQCYSNINHDLRQLKDSIGFNPEVTDGMELVKQHLLNALYFTFLREPKEDFKPAIPLLAEEEKDLHNPFWPAVYNGLDDHLKNSIYGQRLKKRLALCIGQPMPEFTLPTPEGSPATLREFMKGGKITLVHFWATNSAVRKEYDEELRAMYKKYHDKGFNIVGVSSDSYIEQWKETLGEEHYPWPNVLDKKGSTIVDTVYQELGAVDHQNTTNVLVDEQGKILAWDPRGVELQWYLWKHLDVDPANSKNRLSKN